MIHCEIIDTISCDILYIIEGFTHNRLIRFWTKWTTMSFCCKTCWPCKLGVFPDVFLWIKAVIIAFCCFKNYTINYIIIENVIYIAKGNLIVTIFWTCWECIVCIYGFCLSFSFTKRKNTIIYCKLLIYCWNFCKFSKAKLIKITCWFKLCIIFCWNLYRENNTVDISHCVVCIFWSICPCVEVLVCILIHSSRAYCINIISACNTLCCINIFS